MFGSAAESRARSGAAMAGHGNAGGAGSGFGGANQGRDNPMDSRFRDVRYSQNMGVSRPATVGNIARAVVGSLPGPSLVSKAGAMIGGWDPYSGPSMQHTNFSHDGSEHPGMPMQGGGGGGTGMAMLPSAYAAQQAAMTPNKARAAAIMPAPAPAAPDWWRAPFPASATTGAAQRTPFHSQGFI